MKESSLESDNGVGSSHFKTSKKSLECLVRTAHEAFLFATNLPWVLNIIASWKAPLKCTQAHFLSPVMLLPHLGGPHPVTIIFRTPLLSANHIWHNLENAKKLKYWLPGRKSKKSKLPVPLTGNYQRDLLTFWYQLFSFILKF